MSPAACVSDLKPGRIRYGVISSDAVYAQIQTRPFYDPDGEVLRS